MDAKERSLLDELLELESGLTSREIEFLDSLDRYPDDRVLTQAQRDWLFGIARRNGLIE